MRRRSKARACKSILALVLFSVGLTQVLLAEVLDLEGTVVAVSADDRTISIERQTPSGKKRIDLEVARKAGDLRSVRVGSRIAVSYDPSLEIVTQLNSASASRQPSGEVRGSEGKPDASVSRVTAELSPRGGLVFRVEQATDEPNHEPSGGAANPLAGLKGARVTNDDGFYYVDVECDDAAAIAVLGSEGLELRRGSLIADTSVGKDDIGQRAFVGMGRQFRLPFTLQIDTSRQGMARRQSPSFSDCSLNYNFGIASTDGQEVGHVFVSVQPLDPLFSTGKVYVSLREPNKELKQVAERDIRDGKAECRVQVPGISSDSKLSWWCVVRGEPAQIERVRVAGPLVPSVGIELESKAGQVAVKRVVKDGPAEQAGITNGDLLVSVNGERVRDAGSAVAAIAAAKIGDEIILEFKAGGKVRKVTVRAN